MYFNGIFFVMQQHKVVLNFKVDGKGNKLSKYFTSTSKNQKFGKHLYQGRNYFTETTFTDITVAHVWGMLLTGLLQIDKFSPFLAHFSLLNNSTSDRLDGERL
ncbi:hypothetical protein ILYODFUR_027924 [Ilyodon furcidens]|uniref:EH domain-containing protein n=1 Tax=Ilyodon furcidens TaxID=33524 RepID=A0ABV0TEL9_9TELE